MYQQPLITAWKPKFILKYLILVYTSKKTQHSSTKISWLVLFKEIITVCSENHTKAVSAICGQNSELLIVKAGGTYSY
jgi:hypothetical protein